VSAIVLAALLAALGAATVAAATATITTVDVPSGTQFGAFTVTAHVRPAPQPENGFIPAVSLHVDGDGGRPAPLDPNGDAPFELSLSPGSHSIVASFAGFSTWDASTSDPAAVRVGVPTTTTLESSRNPALTTESVTITASVSPAVSGGTLSIVDASDGSTIASGAVGVGTSSLSVTPTLAAGSHDLTASYTGDGDFGPSEAHLTQTVGADTTVDATTRVQYSTFYPYADGYRDTDEISGSLGEPASVRIRIFSPTNALVKTIDLGAKPKGRYTYKWTGRSSSGAILAAGTYRVVQRLTDTANNVRTTTTSITLSHKKLVWTTSTITLTGSHFWGVADAGNGYVSTSRSAYSGGVKLSSGTAGVAVAYKFTVRSAVRYGSTVTFGVVGKSPTGTTVVEGLWNRAYCAPQNVGCYDLKNMGPGYGRWSISGSSALHLDGRTAYGVVAVPYTGKTRTFDVAKVLLVYRWAVLG
jgi:hypothetical protein